jgi:phospholipid/cholesterol/gamma-HCH transport system substrate-binding protein
VRHFESQLAQVAGELADERGDLGQALNLLSTALNEVAGFVRDNASKIHTDVGGLKTLAGILAKEQTALNETLAVAPVALANVVHAYQSSPDAAPGTLGTRSNLASLTNVQGQVCSLLNSLGELTGNLLGALTQPIVAACTKVAGGDLSALPVITNLTNLLGGGLPGVPG